jgi:hypothetical protein
MNKKPKTQQTLDLFCWESYAITSLDDEIRADKNCQELLQLFLKFLLENQNLEPLVAGSHAKGADFFIRDYMIDRCRENIFAITTDKVNGFAGNWYIVNTLEPNIEELKSLLDGIRMFYLFCDKHDLLKDVDLASINSACSDYSYFKDRIESFHNIQDNGYHQWNNSCPVI